MKMINVRNDSTIKKGKSLSKNRKNIFSKNMKDYLYNYNISQNAPVQLMHFVLKKKPSKEILNYAIQNYYINLVSLWETYFRDLFLLVINQDVEFGNYILTKFTKGSSEEFAEEELLALVGNFQNLEDISKAFSRVLDNCELLDYIGSYRTNVFFPDKFIEDFILDKYFENWKEKVREVFYLRHQFVHDANYNHEFNLHDTSEIEGLFNLVPKVFSIIVADKYDLDRVIIEANSDEVIIRLGRGKFNFIYGIKEIIDTENSFLGNFEVKK